MYALFKTIHSHCFQLIWTKHFCHIVIAWIDGFNVVLFNTNCVLEWDFFIIKSFNYKPRSMSKNKYCLKTNISYTWVNIPIKKFQ